MAETSLAELGRRLWQPILEATGARWRAIGWDVEQGITLTLEGPDGAVLLVELERRDDARDCSARTARFNVCARRTSDAAPLGAEERAVVQQVVELVRRREGLLPIAPVAQPLSRGGVREVRVERMLMTEGPRRYYVNPYAGCMVGCEFCYVAERADLSRSLVGAPAARWGRWVDVKTNAAEVLREELRAAPPGLVRMSPILTDPYQGPEARYGITRACLTVLRDAPGFVPGILTRESRILRDLELLRSFPRAGVGFSIPTDDDRVRRAFEPRADPIERRLEALEACSRAGLVTFLVVQPVLPMDAARLVALTAPWVRAVRVERMHDAARVAHLYTAAGCEHAADPAWGDRVAGELRAAFRERGVLVDDQDDLAGLLSVA